MKANAQAVVEAVMETVPGAVPDAVGTADVAGTANAPHAAGAADVSGSGNVLCDLLDAAENSADAASEVTKVARMAVVKVEGDQERTRMVVKFSLPAHQSATHIQSRPRSVPI